MARFEWIATGILLAPAMALASPITLFTTGSPDGRMATLSQPAAAPLPETETADDFIVGVPAMITGATFIGLVPTGTLLASLQSASVDIELYHIFPVDSTTPPDGHVVTRVNSPSDNQFAGFSTTTADITSTPTILNSSFSTANSVVTGIHQAPNQFTGGEGPITGEEVQFTVTFTTPFFVGASDHDFFRPEVGLGSGNFLWLSTARPSPLFNGDLQAWIRNTPLDPDWSRIGTDIVGGTPAPTFNMAFSLQGVALPEPASFLLAGLGMALVAWRRARR